jgi:hypothetical protein
MMGSTKTYAICFSFSFSFSFYFLSRPVCDGAKTTKAGLRRGRAKKEQASKKDNRNSLADDIR